MVMLGASFFIINITLVLILILLSLVLYQLIDANSKLSSVYVYLLD